MRLGTWLAAALLAFGANRAQAEENSDTLVKFGLIGTWAIDCNAPPSMKNPFQTFAALDGGAPTRQLVFGNPAYDHIEPIRDVILITDDRLRLSFSQNNLTITVVLIKDRGRVRPLESTTSGGQTVVSGGIVQRSGQETAWLQRCLGGIP